ncbi:hypothetical protein CSB07_00180 [Candidatus Gracilibacteria bacterium]|nr:MAG: hypothetical protein CSB07_00180 [Candidatus Gracilibacteria bacterium]PIE85642.1 MAG: hypothetical protein CSA08_00890 [Candidatus Gracilibacteria bacterium]
MKINKKASSMIEAIVITLIITMGMVGMFKIYTESIKLSIATKNRIIAIQIAREGIEAMESIRGSNWILYSSDYKNCWNTLNYNGSCINNAGIGTDIQNNTSYVLKNDPSNRWILEEKPGLGSDYTDSLYRTDFRVKKDANGFYTQSGGIDFNPVFTREIKIEYIDTNLGATNSNDEKMLVSSIVQRLDYSSSKPHKIKLETILSNWKE